MNDTRPANLRASRGHVLRLAEEQGFPRREVHGRVVEGPAAWTALCAEGNLWTLGRAEQALAGRGKRETK